MDLYENTERELREYARANLDAGGIRGELANEILTRLNPEDVGDEPDIRARVKNALGLLGVSAFTITREDVTHILSGLSEVCDEKFTDAIFVDPSTEREISFPAISEEEKSLREKYRNLQARLDIFDHGDRYEINDEPPTDKGPKGKV